LSEKCVSLAVEETRQRGRPRKAWKKVVDKDVECLHIKMSDDSKWRKLIRGKLSDRSSDSDAEI